MLIAENELFAAELASVRILADRYTQLVGVYQAMGGGWVDIADVDRAETAGDGGGEAMTHVPRYYGFAARDASCAFGARRGTAASQVAHAGRADACAGSPASR